MVNKQKQDSGRWSGNQEAQNRSVDKMARLGFRARFERPVHSGVLPGSRPARIAVFRLEEAAAPSRNGIVRRAAGRASGGAAPRH